MAQEIADSKLIDTWASSGLIVEPDVSKIIEGWQLGEQPPHEYMNWLQNTFGSKLNHILKNGVASWNNTTQYLAGATVQHNGNVWLCKATNTNSEPTDVNANWKRIITVESLTTVLGGYVELASFIGTNQSKSSNGYQKLPSGLIIQWGVSTNSTQGESVSNVNITFPIAFPNQLLQITASVSIFAQDLGSDISLRNTSSTIIFGGLNNYISGITASMVNFTEIANSKIIRWIAIGY